MLMAKVTRFFLTLCFLLIIFQEIYFLSQLYLFFFREIHFLNYFWLYDVYFYTCKSCIFISLRAITQNIEHTWNCIVMALIIFVYFFFQLLIPRFFLGARGKGGNGELENRPQQKCFTHWAILKMRWFYVLPLYFAKLLIIKNKINGSNIFIIR